MKTHTSQPPRRVPVVILAISTAMGHTRESYAEPEFIGHVLRGIQWAAGVEQE